MCLIVYIGKCIDDSAINIFCAHVSGFGFDEKGLVAFIVDVVLRIIHEGLVASIVAICC